MRNGVRRPKPIVKPVSTKKRPDTVGLLSHTGDAGPQQAEPAHPLESQCAARTMGVSTHRRVEFQQDLKGRRRAADVGEAAAEHDHVGVEQVTTTASCRAGGSGRRSQILGAFVASAARGRYRLPSGAFTLRSRNWRAKDLPPDRKSRRSRLAAIAGCAGRSLSLAQAVDCAHSPAICCVRVTAPT